jgi:hypothetical protein
MLARRERDCRVFGFEIVVPVAAVKFRRSSLSLTRKVTRKPCPVNYRPLIGSHLAPDCRLYAAIQGVRSAKR